MVWTRPHVHMPTGAPVGTRGLVPTDLRIFNFKRSFDQDNFPQEFEALWLRFSIFQFFDFFKKDSTFLISGHKNRKCHRESGRGVEMGPES